MARKLEKLPDEEIAKWLAAFAPGSEEHEAARIEQSIRLAADLRVLVASSKETGKVTWWIFWLTIASILVTLGAALFFK